MGPAVPLTVNRPRDSISTLLYSNPHIKPLPCTAPSMPMTSVTAVFPTSFGLPNEAYEAMRDTVKHYTTMARNAITNSPQSSPSSPAKIPPVQQRRMACTHLTMKRQYGGYRCMVCRRIPEIGWVYMCTQDEADVIDEEQDIEGCNDGLADSDGHWLEESDSDVTVEQQLCSVTRLSPWIEKAILAGHYTREQELLLRLQKQNVNVKISAATAHFHETEAGNTASSKQSPSLDTNSYLPFPVINQVSEPPPDDNLPSPPKSRIFPYCEHRACHNCRSTFRDRAWQRFDDIFEDTTVPSIDFENDDRPLANPAIVATLGLHEPKRLRPQRPLLHTFDSMGIHRARSGRRALEAATANDPDSVDVADQREMSESKGFRNSIKRAFRDMLMSRRESMASTTSSKRSSVSTTRPSRNISRRARLREEAPTDDPMDFDLGLWQRRSEEILREASRIKLPGHDGHDGLESQAEEVEVMDGVAVTEEAVDTGIADIIMAA